MATGLLRIQVGGRPGFSVGGRVDRAAVSRRIGGWGKSGKLIDQNFLG